MAVQSAALPRRVIRLSIFMTVIDAPRDTLLRRAATAFEHACTETGPLDDRKEPRWSDWTDAISPLDPSDRIDLEPEHQQDRLETVLRGGRAMDGLDDDWLSDFFQLIEYLDTVDEPHDGFQTTNTQPFEDFLGHVVDYSFKQFEKRNTNWRKLLSESACTSLKQWLLERLCTLSSKCLQLEFQHHVAKERPTIVFGDSDDVAQSNELYQDFIRICLDDPLEFYTEYPVLARITRNVCNDWIEATVEFLQHVKRDRTPIARTFSDSETLGRICAVTPGLSDPHNGGRTVFEVTFESGLTVIYKPRDVGPEEFYSKTIEFFDSHANVACSGPTVLTRDGRGWIEYVTHDPCSTEADVQQYYRRAGVLIAYFYVTGATDYHFENVIASGAMPVPVDCETITSPSLNLELNPANSFDCEEITRQAFNKSIFKSGAVPNWKTRERDLSAFGMDKPTELASQATSFKNINTDGMEIERHPRTAEPEHNLPRHDGNVIAPDTYVTDIIYGFKQAYQAIQEYSTEFLRLFQTNLNSVDKLRYIFRSTADYTHHLDQLTDPKHLRDGVSWSVKVEELVSICASTEPDYSTFYPLYESERAALLRFDVPYFTIPQGTARIQSEVKDLDFAESMRPLLQDVTDRTQSLSQSDMLQQISLLKAAFDEPSESSDYPSTPKSTDGDDFDRNPISDSTLRDYARDIGYKILDESVSINDNVFWYTSFDGITPVDESLYRGRTGIGLFFVFGGEILDEPAFTSFGATLFEQVSQSAVDAIDANTEPDYPIGGANGIASIAYGLAIAGDQLQRPDLRSLSVDLSSLITDSKIERDTSYGIVEGSAGAILGLLAVYRMTGEEEVINRAIAAGDHLIDASNPTETGHLSWESPFSSHPLAGFSHGISGIAYALFSLWAATGCDRFRQTAIDAVQYESQLFDETINNWPDYRLSESDTVERKANHMDSWCHGRTGVGLARLGIQKYWEGDIISKDLNRALRIPASYYQNVPDTLCCGSLGRAELLLQAGNQLDRDPLITTARQLATSAVRDDDDFGMQGPTDCIEQGLFEPSLFIGAAGGGYTLLRLLRSDTVNSVLLWE